MSQPTLVIGGGRSAARFVDVATRVVALMPCAEQVVIPNLNHMRLPEALPEITDAVREFWSRT
jgi:pimeloyl-ACP methyl ester carboxylesterase